MRKQHSSALKAKVVLEALRETKTLAQIATEYEVHPSLVTKWKAEATGNLPALFERGTSRDEKSEASDQRPQNGRVIPGDQAINDPTQLDQKKIWPPT